MFSFTGGGPSTKNFFPSLNMYQAKSGVKNFSLYWGGGFPRQKIFFPVWTCIKPNLVSKIFPFTGGGGPLTKNLFPSLNMYQAKSGVKNFSLTGGGPSTKMFFWSEHVSSQIWCEKISLYWDWVPPPKKSETGLPPKNHRPGTPPTKIWDRGPPLKIWDQGPPLKIWDLAPPPVHGWIGYPPTPSSRCGLTHKVKI